MPQHTKPPQPAEIRHFYHFEPDTTIPQRVGRIDLIYSTDDHHGDRILKGCEKLQKLWPTMHAHKFTDRNHFSRGTVTQLPEIMEILTPTIQSHKAR